MLHSRRRFLQGSLALAGLSLCSGCGVLPLPGQQPSRVPRIGWLGLNSLSPLNSAPQAFRQGLGELGYLEGETVAIDWRSAEGRPERLPDLANELVRLGVD